VKKKSYGKKGVCEPKFRAGKPIKRIPDVPTLEKAFAIEKEARSKEIRGDYPPISDLSEIFADIVRRTPGIKQLAETLHNRPLRVATMCSGTESPLLALNLISRAIKEQHGISIEIHHVFSCEIEPYKQAYIERNFAPPILFRDVCELGGDQAHTAYGALVDVPGNVDLLVAGTSCVDYSNLNNKKKGMDEGGESGRTFFGMLNWVKKHQPALVLLENVKSAPWAGVGEAFSDINYDAAWSNTFDTKNYYIPHTRQRGYLIATQNRKDSYAGNWEALARSLARPASSSLEDFMLAPDDPRIQKVRTQFALGEGLGKGRSTIDWSKCQQRHERARDEESLGKNRPFTAWEEGGTCRLSHDAWNEWAQPQPERVLDLLDITIMRAAKDGVDPHYKSRVWELSQNVDRNIASARPGICMCLTPSGMPYLTSRGGPMVGLEALSLQGLPIDELLLTRETNDQLQNLAGNAMSSTVVGTCILAALVIARPDLEARRKNQDVDMKDANDGENDEERIITRDGKPGTKMAGHAEDKEYDITSCSKLSISLAEGAVASNQRCTCEGRRGTTSEIVYRCSSCHHTTCAACKSRPEHTFVVDDRIRGSPAAFAQRLKEALPMRIWLQCSSLQDLTNLSEDVASSNKPLLKSWIKRVSSVLSDGVEIRFNELLRQRTWLASYSGYGVRLELLLDDERPHWRLFIEADSSEIAGSPLRKLLRQPVARLLLDLTKKDAFLLDGQWEICLPSSTNFTADFKYSGELVPTWEAKMGIEGDFQGTRRYSELHVQVPASAQSELDIDISGQYHLLADCGTANGSLFVRRETADAARLYFFLDPDRFKGKESDMFVFSSDISKLPHPLERVAIARAPGGWRPKKPKAVKSSSTHEMEGLQESVKITVGGCWRPWSDLKVSTPAHFSAHLAVAERKSFELAPCHHAATIVTISSSVFGSARGLWPKTEGEWYQVDLEHHAATTFRSLAWLTERLQLPSTLRSPMEILDGSQVDCQRCAPSPPAIQWLHVKGRAPVPMENEQQAGPFEQALKKRPAPFVVQMKLEGDRGQVRIGINALTLAHRAMARLPSNEAVQGRVTLSWQLSMTDPTLDLFNLPKYRLCSNRSDPEADTPDLFKIPLRKEQKRSLHWMLAQESHDLAPYQEEEVAEGLLAPLGWRVEGKATRNVLIRGGVLADAVGYGKTAITLGLIASKTGSSKKSKGEAEENIDARFIATKATLVIVPPHLCKQWEGEVKKFCGDSFSVVVIYSKTDLNSLTINEVQEADIVIMSVSVYKSDAYFDSLARLAAANPLPQKAGRYFDSSLQCCLRGLRNRMKELQEDGAAKVDQSVKDRVDFDQSQFTTRKASKRLVGQAYMDAHQEMDDEDASHVESEDAHVAVKDSEKEEPDTWGLRKKAVQKDWKQMFALPMEAFQWQRVVVDEFHYIAEHADRAFAAIKELQAKATWILSGTPPTADFADVQSIASFLHIHLGVPDDEDSTKSSLRSRRDKSRTQAEQFRNFVEIRSADWHHRRQALGQRFLDCFVRQNVAEIDEIPMEVLIKPIRMPAAERACYLELAHMIEALDLRHARRLFRTSQKAITSAKDKKKKGEVDSSNDRDERLQKTLGESGSPDEALSRQASHFILSEEEGSRMSNAIEACEYIVAERKEQRDDCLQQMERDVEAAMKQHFVVLLQRRFRDESNQALVTFAKNVENGAWGDEDCKPILSQLLSRLGCTKQGLSREKGKKLYPSWKQKKEIKEEDWLEEHKLRDMVHMLQRLRNEYWSRVRSLRYFQTVRDIQRARSSVDQLDITCPSEKCAKAGKLLQLEEISIASTCGHSGCNECLLRDAYIGKCCTTDCHAMAKPASIVLASTLGDERDTTTAYGIKLATVATIIKEVIPKKERILLFVQYDGLLKKVSEALEEYGVNFVRISGTATSRSTQLSSFQEGSQRVLLLNIADESAAGSNLTVANHVIFLSALISEEEQSYHATMEQAKGRAVRFGQIKEVKIWRFFVRDTIDQTVFEKRESMKLEEIPQDEEHLQLVDVKTRK
jgi:site-specific DNA-cytosine methylase